MKPNLLLSLLTSSVLITGCSTPLNFNKNLNNSYLQIANKNLRKISYKNVKVEYLSDVEIINKSKEIQNSGGVLIGTAGALMKEQKDDTFKKIAGKHGGNLSLVGDHKSCVNPTKPNLHSYLVAIFYTAVKKTSHSIH